MSRKVLILDTSVVCCWLRVPGKETAGPADDQWDHDRVARLLTREGDEGATFVLPLATLLETGNHIAQAPAQRYELAGALMGKLAEAMVGSSPWAAFTDQTGLWEEGSLAGLIRNWPLQASQKFSIGDALIVHVAEYYASAGYEVEILTGDQGLRAYQPTKPVLVPRRRQ